MQITRPLVIGIEFLNLVLVAEEPVCELAVGQLCLEVIAEWRSYIRVDPFVHLVEAVQDLLLLQLVAHMCEILPPKCRPILQLIACIRYALPQLPQLHFAHLLV